jgi:hypothetical protein
VNQISEPTAAGPSTQAHQQPPPQTQPASVPASPERPGFRSRGRARRRARFLRKARELAYRDLGGLVFNLHRFGQRNDALVIAKLTTIGHIDTELRALESALHERRPVTVLREAGVTACPRCAAIHSSEDAFCPSCGLQISGQIDLPADFQAPASAGAAPAPPRPATPVPSSPLPVSAPPPAAAAPPAAAPAREDGPTEIIRPPAPGS